MSGIGRIRFVGEVRAKGDLCEVEHSSRVLLDTQQSNCVVVLIEQHHSHRKALSAHLGFI